MELKSPQRDPAAGRTPPTAAPCANTQVDLLIQAMVTFGANNGGLSWDQAIDQRPTEVQAILAVYWGPAA